MFIQIIKGKVADAGTFQQASDAWERDVRPTTEGYLGATVGVTADNTFIISARFENAEAAEKNNDGPAQLAWMEKWSPTMTDVEFHNCSQVVLLGGGGSNDAGFVQVMVGKVKDRAKFDALNDRADEMTKTFESWRDDVLGDVVAVHDDDDGYHDIIYFKSEAEARAAEKSEPPAAVQALMAELEAAAEIVAYLDLSNPVLN
ncbi:MAG TPA: hypothetical protein VHS03_14095 [Gaiellaceae bacterium]|jgi:quinol monooxygenase YgiN|nr:hypothetical protein [Gaiellaceae bacterium]